MISNLKNNIFIISLYRIYQASRFYFRFKIFKFVINISSYLKDLLRFKQLNKNNNFLMGYLYPCLQDKTESTPLDSVYFFQDTWAAKKIFELKPKKHVDVGSNAKTIGLISQFVETTMIDIRPLSLNLKGLNFKKGSILELPFKDNSVESI